MVLAQITYRQGLNLYSITVSAQLPATATCTTPVSVLISRGRTLRMQMKSVPASCSRNFIQAEGSIPPPLCVECW